MPVTLTDSFKLIKSVDGGKYTNLFQVCVTARMKKDVLNQFIRGQQTKL